jgi:hypothetical protein
VLAQPTDALDELGGIQVLGGHGGCLRIRRREGVLQRRAVREERFLQWESTLQSENRTLGAVESRELVPRLTWGVTLALGCGFGKKYAVCTGTAIGGLPGAGRSNETMNWMHMDALYAVAEVCCRARYG